MWPPAPAPNVPPPPGPVTTLRPSSYDLLVSTDGTTWHTVARVRTTTTRGTDTLSFAPQQAGFVAVRVVRATTDTTPMLEELVLPR